MKNFFVFTICLLLTNVSLGQSKVQHDTISDHWNEQFFLTLTTDQLSELQEIDSIVWNAYKVKFKKYKATPKLKDALDSISQMKDSLYQAVLDEKYQIFMDKIEELSKQHNAMIMELMNKKGDSLKSKEN